MTKRPKFTNSRTAKIARSDLARQILDAWNDRGLEAAHDIAAKHGARLTRERGIYLVNLSGLSVDHASSFRAAMRRWIALATQGQRGHHPVPKNPGIACATTSVIQARRGVPTQQARAARGDVAMIEAEADQ